MRNIPFFFKYKLLSYSLHFTKYEVLFHKDTSETLNKFEVMDGAPVKGEVVPIRFYLASTDLESADLATINLDSADLE